MIRILDITPSLQTGGIAQGLLQTLTHIDKSRFKLSVMATYIAQPSISDDLRAMGVEIIPAPSLRQNPLGYLYQYWRILGQRPGFDIVHAHPHLSCGILMMLAKWRGIPVRITHIHNDHRTRPAPTNPWTAFWRKLYNAIMRAMIHRYASAGLAVSENAAHSIFGENWRDDPRCRVVYGGTDFCALSRIAQRPIVKPQILAHPHSATSAHTIAPPYPVMGFCGRLVPAKNPFFALDIFEALQTLYPNARLLFIGDGELRPALERDIKRRTLDNHVHITGFTRDAPAFMHQYCDALIMPSHHEGLPRAAIEAQALGLPVLASAAITPECDFSHRVQFLNINIAPQLWAQELDKLIATTPKIPRQSALDLARQSPFDIHEHIQALTRFYDEQIQRSSRHPAKAAVKIAGTRL